VLLSELALMIGHVNHNYVVPYFIQIIYFFDLSRCAVFLVLIAYTVIY